MSSAASNVAASVRARLLNLSREQSEDFQRVLSRFALTRFLSRLSGSIYADRFVLKGAMLLQVWTGQGYRPTRDLDLEGRGNPSTKELASVFRELCRQEVEEADGLDLDPDSVQAAEIREGHAYAGIRIKLVATLDRARIPIQVDVGFGDAITPGVQRLKYPSMLGYSESELSVYPPETVVAEKFEALVSLGMGNSRMKDFSDLWTLAGVFSFEGEVLARAIQATFERRKTEVPKEPPIALTLEFAEVPGKEAQWTGFRTRNEIQSVPETLQEVLEFLKTFLMPPAQAIIFKEEFSMNWSPKGPWVNK